MTEVFLGSQASEFGLKVQRVREDCPTLRNQGRMSTKGPKGLKILILIKILYPLKIILQRQFVLLT
jgi:hypothetical protein